MSAIKFFPIRWFEDASWKSIQVFGRLENEYSVYIRIGFRPYFTVKYPSSISTDIIDESHVYLLSETPIAEVTYLSEYIYRIYVLNKEDYFDSIVFYEKNGIGEIIDNNQEIKSKFFGEKKINPGSWQQATDLKTLFFNVTSNNSYSGADLEFYTNKISTIQHNAPIPKGVTGFFDIEVIPSDNVSFPDAEADRPADNIFGFSLLIVSATLIKNLVYILTDKSLPEKYTTKTQGYQVEIIRVGNEKDLIQRFFQGLTENRVDRLVSMNGRRFDINYIGSRSHVLNVQIPPFSKILNFTPYFYPSVIAQTKPFPLVEQVWAINTPGISQIDILDFYRRLYPQLGNHKLETLAQLILRRGKTGLKINEMFAKYRRGTIEDILDIIDYSINDSILLYELWNTTNIPGHLSQMANEWKNDSEYVITHDLDLLFEDLIRYITPNIPSKNNNLGKVLTTERKSGVHRNIYLYSLSNIYLDFLEQTDPSPNSFTKVIVNYFRNTNNGLIPFNSGYFPVTFDQVENHIRKLAPQKSIIWIDENSLAVKEQIPNLTLMEFIPLTVISHKSWILVNSAGIVFKKGLSSFVRPPFRLIERYVDYLINFLVQNPGQSVVFPNFDTSLEDFVMETKVTAEDFINPPSRKAEIIQQLRELSIPVTYSWRKVYFIRTKNGNIIQEIYSKNPDLYIPEIDISYYNDTLQKTLKSLFV